MSVERGKGMQESLTAAIFRGVVVPATALAKAVLVEGARKQIRLGLFGLGSRRQFARLLLFRPVSELLQFPLQSRELLRVVIHIAVNSRQDVIHIAVYSHSLSANSSAQRFNHVGQP